MRLFVAFGAVRRAVPTLALVAAVNVLLLAGYHAVFVAGRGLAVGVVDMSAVTAATRSQYLKRLVATNQVEVSEAAAQHYLDQTDATVSAVIYRIERECRCLLLAHGTVVWSAGMRDYTQRVIAAIEAGG